MLFIYIGGLFVAWIVGTVDLVGKLLRWVWTGPRPPSKDYMEYLDATRMDQPTRRIMLKGMGPAVIGVDPAEPGKDKTCTVAVEAAGLKLQADQLPAEEIKYLRQELEQLSLQLGQARNERDLQVQARERLANQVEKLTGELATAERERTQVEDQLSKKLDELGSDMELLQQHYERSEAERGRLANQLKEMESKYLAEKEARLQEKRQLEHLREEAGKSLKYQAERIEELESNNAALAKDVMAEVKSLRDWLGTELNKRGASHEQHIDQEGPAVPNSGKGPQYYHVLPNGQFIPHGDDSICYTGSLVVRPDGSYTFSNGRGTTVEIRPAGTANAAGGSGVGAGAGKPEGDRGVSPPGEHAQPEAAGPGQTDLGNSADSLREFSSLNWGDTRKMLYSHMNRITNELVSSGWPQFKKAVNQLIHAWDTCYRGGSPVYTEQAAEVLQIAKRLERGNSIPLVELIQLLKTTAQLLRTAGAVRRV